MGHIICTAEQYWSAGRRSRREWKRVRAFYRITTRMLLRTSSFAAPFLCLSSDTQMIAQTNELGHCTVYPTRPLCAPRSSSGSAPVDRSIRGVLQCALLCRNPCCYDLSQKFDSIRTPRIVRLVDMYSSTELTQCYYFFAAKEVLGKR